MAGKKAIPGKQALERLTTGEPVSGFILLLCPDEVRSKRARARLLKSAGVNVAAKNTSGYESLDARSFRMESMRSIEDKLFSLSLFSTTSIFAISHIESASAAVCTALAKVLKRLPEGVTVLVTGCSLPASNALVKLSRSLEQIIQFAPMSKQDLARWCRTALQRTGIPEAQSAAVDLFLDISDGDPDQLQQMVEQVALYLGASKESPIDSQLAPATILEVFVHHPDPREFDLLDFLSRGERAKADLLLRQLLRSGKSEFLLLSMLSRTFSQYLLVQHLLKGGKTEAQIRTTLKLPPGIVRKVVEAAKRYSQMRLMAARREILRTDAMLKSRSLGSEVLLSRLCDCLAL